MKRALSASTAIVLLSSVLAACGSDASNNAGASQSASPSGGAASSSAAPSDSGKPKEKVTINLWSFTDEIPNMTKKYTETHPDANVEFKTTVIATTDGAYQPALDQALAGGGKDAPISMRPNRPSS